MNLLTANSDFVTATAESGPYPESEEHPLSETDKNISLMMPLRFILGDFFRYTAQALLKK